MWQTNGYIFFLNCLLFLNLVIAFCLLLFVVIIYYYFLYACHEFVGFKDLAIWSFHVKDLFNLTGLRLRPFLWLGMAPDFCDTKGSARRPRLPEI